MSLDVVLRRKKLQRQQTQQQAVYRPADVVVREKTPTATTTVYRPPDVIVGERTRRIEKQIRAEYEKAPIMAYTPYGKPDYPTKRVPTAYYYKPTPEQQKRIMGLVKKLPYEPRAKYVVQPPRYVPPPTWKTATVAGRLQYGRYWGPEWFRPVKEFVGGLLGGPEYYYRLIRGEPTPPEPIGGLVGVGLGAPKTWEEYVATPPAYKVGQFVWMVPEAVAFGWVGKKVFAGVKAVTPKFIKAPIARAAKFGRVAKVVHKGKLVVKRVTPTWRGSRVEQFLIKRVPWYAKRAGRGITRGEVGLKYMPERVGLPHLKASKLAWELTQFPRTGGVLIRQYPTVSKGVLQPFVGEWVLKGTELVYRFRPARAEEFVKTPVYRESPKQPLKKTWFKKPQLPMFEHRGLLPYVTQTQVTRMGIHPYIPKAVTATGKKGINTFGVGLGVITLTKLRQPTTPKRKPRRKLITVPKVWKPTLAYEREKFRPLTLPSPKVKERERLIPALKIPTAQIQPQIPKQLVTPKLLPKQKQVLAPKIPTPQIPKLTPPTLPPYWKRGGGRDVSRLARTFWGKWFKREHRLPTAKEMSRRLNVLITAKPKKRRKRRRVKRRGGVPKLWF